MLNSNAVMFIIILFFLNIFCFNESKTAARSVILPLSIVLFPPHRHHASVGFNYKNKAENLVNNQMSKSARKYIHMYMQVPYMFHWRFVEAQKWQQQRKTPS